MARTRRNAGPVLKPCPTNAMELLETTVEGYVLTGKIKFTPETGGSFVGTVPEINGLLAAMGYAAVAVRTNMMSRLPYLEAKDTPIYCSPASETYWSM